MALNDPKEVLVVECGQYEKVQSQHPYIEYEIQMLSAMMLNDYTNVCLVHLSALRPSRIVLLITVFLLVGHFMQADMMYSTTRNPTVNTLLGFRIPISIAHKIVINPHKIECIIWKINSCYLTLYSILMFHGY